jgi:NAD-dependent dihydropyrimidine dehydrogenase PreA subunit
MILCFSGTGNSMYAAKCISKSIGNQIININDMLRSEGIGNLKSDGPWVLVCPVYAWRIPRVVEKFIRDNNFIGDRRMYFLLTCDSEPGSSDMYIKRLCKEKGFVYMGTSSVRMPENLIAMYSAPSEKECEAMMHRADKRIRGLAQLIKSEVIFTDDKPKGLFKSVILNPLFYKHYVKPEGFHTTDKCNSCGLCVSNCPLDNIMLVNGAPKWGENCTFCMSCICRCSTEAIEFKEKTKDKRRYICKDFE